MAVTGSSSATNNISTVVNQLSSDLAAKKVIQVVSATYSTQVQTSSLTYIDSGLTATITPSSTSNKILVSVVMPFMTYIASGTVCSGFLNIVRGSTEIRNIEVYNRLGASASEIQLQTNVALEVLDSPATTSATTYKVQCKLGSGSLVRAQYGNYTSSIILMEVLP